jgi:hypothetical protein
VLIAEQVRRDARAQGMTLAIPDSPESFNTPELWKALRSYGWDMTADKMERAAKDGAGALTNPNKSNEIYEDFSALLKEVASNKESRIDVPELIFQDESDAARRRRYQWET